MYGCYVAAGFFGNFLSFGFILTCQIPLPCLLPQVGVRKDGMADRSEAISSTLGKGVSHELTLAAEGYPIAHNYQGLQFSMYSLACSA